MKQLDMRGKACPMPVIETKKTVGGTEPGRGGDRAG